MQFCNTRARTQTSVQRHNATCYKSLFGRLLLTVNTHRLYHLKLHQDDFFFKKNIYINVHKMQTTQKYGKNTEVPVPLNRKQSYDCLII